MSNNILVFACDHRNNVNWNLPYIRLGNVGVDSTLSVKDDEITPMATLLSEGAHMWYVFKHLKEFGNPDLVGFCHYRRFFSQKLSNLPILNISENQFKNEQCLTPFQQLNIMNSMNSDIMTFVPIPLNISDNQTIIDALKIDPFGLDDWICDLAFKLFLDNTPIAIKKHIEDAMYEKRMYVCNIFTMKNDLFRQYCEMFIPTMKQLYAAIPQEKFKYLHPRFLGYILERFTSLYIHGMQKSGKNITIAPLLTIDAQKHVKWEKPQ